MIIHQSKGVIIINITGYIAKRIESLTDIRDKVMKEMERLPEGKLRFYKQKGSYRYHIRKDLQDKNGKYINRRNMGLAQKLAQKEYDRNLIDALEQEISLLESYLKYHDSDPWVSAYEMMAEGERILAVPPIESDEEYIQKWLKQEYNNPEFRENAFEFYTKRGEKMRSKSEVIIAEIFDDLQIPYLYEKPIVLNKIGVVHPDFTILRMSDRKEIIWEHFGMMDDLEYRNNAFGKIRGYENNGYISGKDIIYTFETSKYPLNTRYIRKLARGYI